LHELLAEVDRNGAITNVVVTEPSIFPQAHDTRSQSLLIEHSSTKMWALKQYIDTAVFIAVVCHYRDRLNITDLEELEGRSTN